MWVSWNDNDTSPARHSRISCHRPGVIVHFSIQGNFKTATVIGTLLIGGEFSSEVRQQYHYYSHLDNVSQG